MWPPQQGQPKVSLRSADHEMIIGDECVCGCYYEHGSLLGIKPQWAGSSAIEDRLPSTPQATTSPNYHIELAPCSVGSTQHAELVPCRCVELYNIGSLVYRTSHIRSTELAPRIYNQPYSQYRASPVYTSSLVHRTSRIHSTKLAVFTDRAVSSVAPVAPPPLPQHHHH